MRDETFNIRMSKAEKQAFRDAANLAGVGLSTWMRERLRYAAINELKQIDAVPQFLLQPEAEKGS